MRQRTATTPILHSTWAKHATHSWRIFGGPIILNLTGSMWNGYTHTQVRYYRRPGSRRIAQMKFCCSDGAPCTMHPGFYSCGTLRLATSTCIQWTSPGGGSRQTFKPPPRSTCPGKRLRRWRSRPICKRRQPRRRRPQTRPKFLQLMMHQSWRL